MSGVTRRRMLKTLAAGAAGAAGAVGSAGCGGDGRPGDSGGAARGSGAGRAAGGPGNPLAAGTPTDPDLINPTVPWDSVLTEDELRRLAALCDVIIPADDRSPSAASIGAQDFINEWVSAPYEGNQNDLTLIRGGLAWLDREATARFGSEFSGLPAAQARAICDDICMESRAAPEFKTAARFFDRVRDLTSTAFWTSAEGMEDLGFVGNRPMASFEGPPREVLDLLGITP